jgi:hypothetical protein
MQQTINLNFEPNPKQDLAWKYLNDSITTELLFGGGAGGGKSYLGCVWILACCYRYPSSRWLIGRSVLKSLKESTLQTLLGVFNSAGMKKDLDFKYNEQSGVITFSNKSEIYLKDLFQNPSDPEFDTLGSTEFTGAFIDEANQVSYKAKEVVKSRLRYKLDEFGIIPKLLMTCNPARGWAYDKFYKPYNENKLLPYQQFVPALVGDNSHVSKHYVTLLEQLEDSSRERLLYGNWDYDDDPTVMIPYDKIVDIFDNMLTVQGGIKYIVADIARFGKDKTVISVWDGLTLVEIITIDKSDLIKVKNTIEDLRAKYRVSISNVIVDEDGVGGGVVDMGGYKGFVANSQCLYKENYNNLKSQCAYTIAKRINEGMVSSTASIDEDVKNQIMKELATFKTHKADQDGKTCFIPKDKQKVILGASPDYGDIFIMRGYVEVLSAKDFDSSHLIHF